MVDFKNELFVMQLTDKNADVERAIQEINILKRKLHQLPSENIELKNIILKGKKFIEFIELEYLKEGKVNTLKISRNDFYGLTNL